MHYYRIKTDFQATIKWMFLSISKMVTTCVLLIFYELTRAGCPYKNELINIKLWVNKSTQTDSGMHWS